MSHFTTLSTQLTDADALRAALGDVGYPEVETHAEEQPLYGYRGDRRRDRAHVIVRRKHVGHASNDIGFRRERDGTFAAVISEFDRTTHDDAWLGRLTARHAYHVTGKTLAAQGFQLVNETTEQDGSVRMVLRRVQ